MPAETVFPLEAAAEPVQEPVAEEAPKAEEKKTDVIPGADLDIWFGLWAPNKVPAEIMERMTQEVTKALNSPALKKRYNDLGAEPAPLETAAFRKLLADEGKMLSTLIKERKIVAD